MKVTEHERRDWIIVAIIMLFGLLCVILAGQWASVFAPSWSLNADMGSKLDINRNLLANQPDTVVEAIDSSILTQPVWFNVFLTPGAAIPTRIPSTATLVPPATPTRGLVFSPTAPSPTSTATFIYFPQTITATSNPAFTKTSTPQPSSTATATNTATPTNTATRTNTPTSTPTPTNVPLPEADLQISITDNATDYDAGRSIQYTIAASNPVGPSSVIGATVTSAFSGNLTNITWSCSASGGASCTANGAGALNDAINLPVGGSATYFVNATVVASPGGDLVSTVSIAPPVGLTETAPANNSDTDTDQLIIASTFPYGNIDPVKNDSIEYVPTDTIITLQFNTPLTVGSHSGYDLVYYELPQGANPGIWMDCVILQVGDGANWYTVLNWGDNDTDTNASMNMSTVGLSSETDNLIIDASFMYDLTGIALELDGFVPAGTYKYFRIISPATPPDDNDGVEIDAIAILP